MLQGPELRVGAILFLSTRNLHTGFYTDLLICAVSLSEFMEQNLKCHLVTETSRTSGCFKSSLSTEIIPRASENSEISLELKM